MQELSLAVDLFTSTKRILSRYSHSADMQKGLINTGAVPRCRLVHINCPYSLQIKPKPLQVLLE
jgi:hypothetical protein